MDITAAAPTSLLLPANHLFFRARLDEALGLAGKAAGGPRRRANRRKHDGWVVPEIGNLARRSRLSQRATTGVPPRTVEVRQITPPLRHGHIAGTLCGPNCAPALTPA